jgi:hypothetical protein
LVWGELSYQSDHSPDGIHIDELDLLAMLKVIGVKINRFPSVVAIGRRTHIETKEVLAPHPYISLISFSGASSNAAYRPVISVSLPSVVVEDADLGSRS